jgi:replicative DNA helicase
MNAEARLISSVCEQKDIATVLAADIDDMLVSHRDVWEGVKQYYFTYQSVPDIEVVEHKFSDFERAEVKADTRFYVDEVKNEYINTELAGILEGAVRRHGRDAGKDLVEKLLKKVSVLAKDADVIRDLNLTDADAAHRHFEEKRKRAVERGGAVGIQSGFKVMDSMYPTGMAGGHNIVLIGWSGHGKSWFGTLLACRAWAQGYKPMIVSLEMSPEEVRDRAYTIMGSGEFRHSDFARGMVNVDRFDRWAGSNLTDKQDFVVVSSEGHGKVTPSTVQTKIDQHRPDLLILDYQQLFDSDENEGNETVRNRRISRDFKRLATRNDIPVVNLTQATFSDPDDTLEPPRIEQVAWSKGIQQDADLALAVHKFTDSDIWSIIARKNRHGEEFTFALDWALNDGLIKESI